MHALLCEQFSLAFINARSVVRAKNRISLFLGSIFVMFSVFYAPQKRETKKGEQKKKEEREKKKNICFSFLFCNTFYAN